MASRVLELFTKATRGKGALNWGAIVQESHCVYLGRKCLKNRKSNPSILIGTCVVEYGAESKLPVIICPYRFLQSSRVFLDSLHLLMRHEPGNDYHVVKEINLPGGSVDYCLASIHSGKVADFVGIELQSLDTTGTVWPERQRFLRDQGVKVLKSDAESAKGFGMNWKMNAKTILVQIHHKLRTFEHLRKNLVLVVQDHFMAYMKNNFQFESLRNARIGDSVHFHVYSLMEKQGRFSLQLANRESTDSDGIAQSLGLQADHRIELADILRQIEGKIGPKTKLAVV